VLEKEPRNSRALLIKADALVQAGRGKEALKITERILLTDENNELALLIKVEGLKSLGMTDELIKTLRKLTEINGK